MKFLKYILVLSVVLTSCKGKEKPEAEAEVETSVEVKVEKAEAVCIAAISLRQDPFRTKNNYISTINLGEKVNYLGKTEVDTATDKTYYNVELSDGKVGWAQEYGILIDAKPAAVVNKTPIYNRPDLVTKSNNELYKMNFIAIVGEKDDWVEIVSGDRRKKGWIQSRKVTTKTEDVATATLAHKVIFDKNGNLLEDNIQGFLEELPYENTQFKSYLEEFLDEKVEEAIEESIEEYEGEDYAGEEEI